MFISAPDKIAVSISEPARPPVTVENPMDPMERMQYDIETRVLGEVQADVGAAAEHLRSAWVKVCDADMLADPRVVNIFGDFLRFAVTFRPEVTNGSPRDDTMESEND